MSGKITDKMESIRNSWTESEREDRKKQAAEMQLQLTQIVVLSRLSESLAVAEESSLQMSNAC